MLAMSEQIVQPIVSGSWTHQGTHLIYHRSPPPLLLSFASPVLRLNCRMYWTRAQRPSSGCNRCFDKGSVSMKIREGLTPLGQPPITRKEFCQLKIEL